MTAKKDPPKRKVRERRPVYAGFGGWYEERVAEVPADAPLPEGAEYVDDDTPCCDWQPVGGRTRA